MPALLLSRHPLESLTSLKEKDDIFHTWRVVSKAKEAIDDGPRFENLSWRLWFSKNSGCESSLKLNFPRIQHRSRKVVQVHVEASSVNDVIVLPCNPDKNCKSSASSSLSHRAQPEEAVPVIKVEDSFEGDDVCMSSDVDQSLSSSDFDQLSSSDVPAPAHVSQDEAMSLMHPTLSHQNYPTSNPIEMTMSCIPTDYPDSSCSDWAGPSLQPTCVDFEYAPHQHDVYPLSCGNCGVSQTPLWRKGVNNDNLCNACGLYEKLHHTSRPRTMKPATARKEEGPSECSNCKTQNTPLWRRDDENKCLCNACGLYFKLHRAKRPLSLKTDVIRKRHRNDVVPRKKSKRDCKEEETMAMDHGSSGSASKDSSAKHQTIDGFTINLQNPNVPFGSSKTQSLPPPPPSPHITTKSRSALKSRHHNPISQPTFMTPFPILQAQYQHEHQPTISTAAPVSVASPTANHFSPNNVNFYGHANDIMFSGFSNAPAATSSTPYMNNIMSNMGMSSSFGMDVNTPLMNDPAFYLSWGGDDEFMM